GIALGKGGATVVWRGGWAFWGGVTGVADPFVPLIDYLREAHKVAIVPAVEIQEMLWTWYKNGDTIVGAGISAMPSLHVGIAFSFFLLGQAISRRLGILGAAYAAIILISSVHLGWHYAVDGYAAIVGTWIIWFSPGRLLDRPAVSKLLWGDSQPARPPRRRTGHRAALLTVPAAVHGAGGRRIASLSWADVRLKTFRNAP